MGIFLVYILKSAACLAVFYLFYKLLMSRDTFHRFNRFALLGLLVLSSLLPLVEVSVEDPAPVHETMLTLEQLLMLASAGEGTEAAVTGQPDTVGWIQVMMLVYLAGIAFFALRNGWSLCWLGVLLRRGRLERVSDYLPGRGGITLFFTFTMFFNGGIITTYMVVRSLGLLNTPLAVILPVGINVYNLIVAKTFIQNSIPGELLEAATIDGCSDIGYFIKIVLPLSKAIIAVLVLYYGVYHWNSYFNAMLYLHDKSIYPLTLFLREILMADQIDPSTVTDPELQARIAEAAGVIKYALIVVSMVPVMLLYPFIQKYFVKGVMIGSIKG